MQRVSLSNMTDLSQLESCVKKVATGRYFRNLSPDILRKTLLQGDLLELEPDESLICEGDEAGSEMFILIEGSLAIVSKGSFILRLDTAGDLVGEMSVLSPSPRSADVIAEEPTRLFAFHRKLFAVKENAKKPSFYVMFSHILAEKLRVTTAQSLLRKDERSGYSLSGKVGVIENDPVEQNTIRGVVSTEWRNIESLKCYTQQQFLQLKGRDDFDLLIVDLECQLDGLDEKESSQALLSRCSEYDCPILVVSELCNSLKYREFFINHGATELLGKPYSIVELRNIIANFQKMYLRERELDHIERIAETDRLTGLANRHRLEGFLDALITTYPESKQPFSMIIADVDHFKHYNDHNGHPAGDVVLSRVAAIFYKNVRKGDLAARYGGEEFVMVLPNCPKEGAHRVAEKLRYSIADEDFPHQDAQPLGNLTATFGVSTFPDDAANLEELIQCADDSLYRGKQEGRNRVVHCKPK